jgi:hypothetical protein
LPKPPPVTPEQIEQARLEVRRKRQRDAYRLNRKKKIARVRAYQKGAGADVARKARRGWKGRNKHKVTAERARRRAAEHRPLWASPEAIERIYALAQTMSVLMGVPYEVDHIVALRGERACGLHVEDNLQVITALENRRKGNRLTKARKRDLFKIKS